MEDCEITYNGEAWTEGKLEETPPEDDSDANTILTLILKKRSETVVPIFKELVSVRTEIARENGYDNYVDYAYEELYNRDFTPGEVRALYPVIKDEISPLYMQAQLLFYTMESDDEALNHPRRGNPGHDRALYRPGPSCADGGLRLHERASSLRHREIRHEDVHGLHHRPVLHGRRVHI